MSNRLLVIAPLAISAALILGACGGDGDDEDIINAIEASATTSEPENCTELQTLRFTEQTQAAEGQAAIEACEGSDESSDASSVEVSNIEIDGDSATADVAVEGSTFDGQTLVIALVKEDDQWKLDQIEDIPGFDLEAFVAAFSGVATQGDNALTEQQADCIAKNFRSEAPDTVKEAVLSGDPQRLAPIFQGCL